MPVRIIGTGSCLPPHVYDSDQVAGILRGAEVKGLPLTGEWIRNKTGIETRHFLTQIIDGQPEDPGVSDIPMAVTASQQAIEAARIQASELDALWFISCTQKGPDYFSKTSSRLQVELGMRQDSLALELNSGCGGVMMGIAIARDMMNGNGTRYTLIVASNITSDKFIAASYLQSGSWLSPVMFGDGAGAVVLEKVDDSWNQIMAAFAASDGNYPLMHLKPVNGLGARSLTEEHSLVYYIDAKQVAISYPILMSRALDGLRAKCGFDLDKIKRFYFHQANLRLLEKLAAELNIPMNRVAVNVDRHGNTAAASTLILLDEDVRKGVIQPGDLLLFCGVGAGAHYGAFIVRL